MSDQPKPTLDKDLDKLDLIETGTRSVLARFVAPGFGLIFLAAATIFAALSAAESPEALVVVAGAAIAAYMAMNIGANDVTNNVGAAVGARAISLAGALLLAAFFEIAGAIFFGGNVIQTVKSGILEASAIGSSGQTMLIMIGALLAASLWINIATWINAPVSTTHSIIGAIIGATAAEAGVGAVAWQTVSEITLGWLISPILGGLIAAGLLWFIKETILYREDKIAAANRWVPVLLSAMSGAFLTFLLLLAAERHADFSNWHALGIGGLAIAASFPAYRDLVARQSRELENRNQSLKILFRLPLIFSAALMSFAHGANDVSNAIGPLAAIVEASGIQTITTNMDAPFWVVFIGALGISVGLLLFGPRLIRIVGSQITKLNPFRAYCVSMASAITVVGASLAGMPVSSTHVAVGAIFGVGLFREWYTARSARRKNYIEAKAASLDASEPGTPLLPLPRVSSSESENQRYRFLVRRSYLLSILAAWVVTVPLSALLAAGLVGLFHLFFA
jgi:PiT family inorganic phosphate transporter